MRIFFFFETKNCETQNPKILKISDFEIWMEDDGKNFHLENFRKPKFEV